VRAAPPERRRRAEQIERITAEVGPERGAHQVSDPRGRKLSATIPPCVGWGTLVPEPSPSDSGTECHGLPWRLRRAWRGSSRQFPAALAETHKTQDANTQNREAGGFWHSYVRDGPIR
jgi:hypothetical protein